MATLENRTRTALALARTASGLSLADVSDASGISVSTLSRIESGDRRITIESLERIAAAVGTTPSTIIATAARQEELVLATPPVRLAGGIHGTVLRVDDRGRSLLRLTVPGRASLEDVGVHDGTEWMHVLTGRLGLRVGERSVVLEQGQTAQFDTTAPHAFGGYGGSVEILSRFEPGAHRQER